MDLPKITDEHIASMTPDARRDLITRLERPMATLVSPSAVKRAGRVRFAIMVGGSALLIPWIVWLSLTLPQRYVVERWPMVWVGFDSLLVVMMALTAWFGFKRRLPFLLTAFATGVLLLCDAWFDVMTAARGDLPVSILIAAIAEVPLGLLLIFSTLRMMRLFAARNWLLHRGMHLWDVRLPL